MIPIGKIWHRNLRNLALEIANTCDMHSEAKQITKIVAELFKELPQVADKFSEDLTALEDIIEHKTKNKEEERKRREECSLNIEFWDRIQEKIHYYQRSKIKDPFMRAVVYINSSQLQAWNPTNHPAVNGIGCSPTFPHVNPMILKSPWSVEGFTTIYIELEYVKLPA